MDTVHHHFTCIFPHQDVFLRLTWEITKEIAGSFSTKDTLASLPLIVSDICVALGYLLTRQCVLWPTSG